MNDSVDKEIVNMYLEIKSLTKVAKYFKKSPITVKKILKDNGIALAVSPLTVQQINELLKKNNISDVEIEKQYSHKSSKELRLWLSKKIDYSISQSMIEKLLKLLNISKPYRTLMNVNDDRSKFLLNEWDKSKNNQDISQLSIGSSKDFWWICSLGHSFKANVYDRYSLNYDCSVCAGKIVLAGFNDLLSKNFLIADEWNYNKNGDLKPDMVAVVSGRKVWWMCSKDNNHEWEAKISARTNKTTSTGCPYCANQKVILGENDLQTKFPKIANDWNYDKNDLTPFQIFPSSNKKFWWKCIENHDWKTRASDRTLKNYTCPRCSHSGVSKMEQNFGEFLESIYSGTIGKNDRKLIAPKELDFYLPDLQIAFEFNGLYWHSEASGKDKNYHYDKWKKCFDKGIQLITVWEDDWNLNRPVVEKVLAHKLGMSNSEKIGARKTFVDSKISFSDASQILNNNHIQGSVSGSDYIGLRSQVDNSLIAVMVLKRSFKATGELDVEIVRYATSQSVQGGFTKLLKYVVKEFSPNTVTTFSDNEISNGGLYERHGFEKVYELKPDYKYIVGGERKHKFLFRKKRFETDSEMIFEDGLTERELADLNGLYRVYDSGKMKWVKCF